MRIYSSSPLSWTRILHIHHAVRIYKGPWLDNHFFGRCNIKNAFGEYHITIYFPQSVAPGGCLVVSDCHIVEDIKPFYPVTQRILQ